VGGETLAFRRGYRVAPPLQGKPEGGRGWGADVPAPFPRCARSRGLGTVSRVNSLDILGVRVDDVTYAEALALLREYAAGGEPHYVVTPNPEFVMAARRDPAFRAALAGAALAVPDGGGLLLAARLWGRPFREQVRGTDLVYSLAAEGARRGDRWFFLGAGPGVAAAAGRRLAALYPGLQVAGAYAGSPDPADDATTTAVVRAAGPVDVLLVAYGAPRQEFWMARNVPLLGIPVALGVGGVLDYVAGRVPRAPRWVQRLGVEWLYRLVRQPWRWRRQLALPCFALLALWETPRRRAAPATWRAPGAEAR
jgi:N-acetylglucosaminyldiphosphoundecaprenol N-acetyl-beta-D-mannosaminyltransferase